ncbi:unnamed protein product [Brassicogethes aeneus]|uniref:Helicase POLQ-like n=1 Tax=Brassicogethes aeneus TaxID=1431903 RepID=A0A9P0AYJ4_BRAAE|nr:unnamed protein product [Brassicogethes aeneus]
MYTPEKTKSNNLNLENIENEPILNKNRTKRTIRNKRFAALSLKSVSSSSSGLSLLENEDPNEKPIKRPNPYDIKNKNEKKPRITNNLNKDSESLTQGFFNSSQDLFECPDLTQQLIVNSKRQDHKQLPIDISGVGVLQDTLDFININTQLIEAENCSKNNLNNNKSDTIIKPNICNKKSFDAFRECLKDTKDIMPVAESKNINEINSLNDFSQLFRDTQVLKSIDLADKPEENELFKIPNCIPMETAESKTLNDTNPLSEFSQLFKDSQVTTKINLKVEKAEKNDLKDNITKLLTIHTNPLSEFSQLFKDSQVTNKIKLKVDKGEKNDLKDKITKLLPIESKNIKDTNNFAEFSQLFKDSQIFHKIDSDIEKAASRNKNLILLPTEMVESENIYDTNNLSEFSEIFKDTQVLNKIESEVTNAEKSSKKQFKIPKLLSTYEKIKSMKKDLHKQKDNMDKTALFNDKTITDEYRTEVDSLFDKIEESICEMGTTKNSLITDEVFDVIFNDEPKQDKKGDNQTIQNINWSDESFDSLNASIGTNLKNALLGNALKGVQSQLELSCLNLSIMEEKPMFYNMGPFFGLPLRVMELIKQYKGIEDLYDWQKECLLLPSIQDRKNLIYALPTSGGKTLVAEILILKELLCYKKNVLFILPYVAIVQEKVWSLSPFAVALDFLVEEYASSKGTYPPRKRRRKKSVFIATIEKALGLVNSLIETGRLNELGLVVIDELHLLGEEGRGATLEAVLTKLMFLKANVHLIGMSATIGNLSEICKFLNADKYTKNFRPVELTEFVKCGNEIAKVNWNYTDKNDLLIEPKRVNFKYSESLAKLDPDMIGGLVSDIVPKSSCLIFCPSKKNCENVAYLLCKTANPIIKEHRKVEKGQILHALKDESGELCGILNISINFGIAYHHSGLTSDERRIIEEGFRAGVICIICCTSTLAAGVNLPARRVILRSPYLGREFLNLSRYKQMVGRAGRAGLGEAGDSILITNPEDLERVKQLLLSPMNEARSGMHLNDSKGYRHLVLSCISLRLANTRSSLLEFANHTLMAVQCDKLQVCLKSLTDGVIRSLFKLGAIQEQSDKKETESPNLDLTIKIVSSMPTQAGVSMEEPSTSKAKKTVVLKNTTKFIVSKMGSAAIKGGLELSKAHILYEDLYQAQNSLVLLDCLHLLYLVTPYDTSEQIKPNMQVYYHILTHLDKKQLQTAKVLGLNESVSVKMISGQPIKNVSERVINRFYVTLMLYDLWNETPVFEVSEKYQINRGIVQNLMVSAATFSSNVVQFCEELEEFWSFSHLLKGMSTRLSHCCVKELIPLMELPAVKQGRAKQLYNAGYKNLQSVAKANVNDLMESIEFMSRTVANQLISAAKMLLLEKVENLREEAEDVLDGVEISK